MYVVQRCGHKTRIKPDIVEMEADLREVAKRWGSTVCAGCERRAWIDVAQKLVPPDSDLPKLKGRQKREGYEARRQYLTLYFGILYDDELEEELKGHYQDQVRKLQIYHAWIMGHTDPQWWLEHRISYHWVKNARPTVYGVWLFRKYVGDLLVAELLSKG